MRLKERPVDPHLRQPRERHSCWWHLRKEGARNGFVTTKGIEGGWSQTYLGVVKVRIGLCKGPNVPIWFSTNQRASCFQVPSSLRLSFRTSTTLPDVCM